MATPTKYTYSISTDFPNGKVATDRLSLEIQESAIVIALDYINTAGDACDIWFKDVLSTGDETTLDGIVAAHSGEPLPDMNFDGDGNLLMSDPKLALETDGSQKMVVLPTPGSEKNFYAPNMADKCCWYPDAIRVDDEELTDSDDHTTYESDHTFWIDLTHGRVFKEDALLAANADYAVKVEVQTGGTGDWVEKTENTWDTTPLDGDYGVDYETGEVTFNSALGATDKVRASYSYADGYVFEVVPSTGKMLKVVYAEVQYMQDIEYTTTVNFAIMAGLTTVGGYAFKRLRNFYEESVGPYPVIPPHGGESEVVETTGLTEINAKLVDGYHIDGSHYDETEDEWVAMMHGIKANGGRSMRHPILTVPFHYNAFVPLYSSYGMKIRITLENDKPFGGTFANITFYCFSEDDPNV